MFVETVMFLYYSIYLKYFCNIKNVFTVTFDQINAFLLNKSINFFPKTNKNH